MAVFSAGDTHGTRAFNCRPSWTRVLFESCKPMDTLPLCRNQGPKSNTRAALAQQHLSLATVPRRKLRVEQASRRRESLKLGPSLCWKAACTPCAPAFNWLPSMRTCQEWTREGQLLWCSCGLSPNPVSWRRCWDMCRRLLGADIPGRLTPCLRARGASRNYKEYIRVIPGWHVPCDEVLERGASPAGYLSQVGQT
ncbi:hypothetical protein CONLIGDRAFT_107952 [Coniochaeta ligniaria NRRL 30616]|uniref:Uncharacterized protein n=1 Tax=Coniochaeta ligniaria NRRL 30616 TaxID=1408157 RepID=A0A1J7I9V4_9PEZI|nr:hypothetical protein CONLIGDRAFT_107952 [Coniochaeta ligniaria NRRL 30616]